MRAGHARILGTLAAGLAVAGVLLAGAAGAPARAGSSAPAHAAASSYLQVIEVEYRLLLSRGVVKAGPVSLEALDHGMDPHDLRLAQLGASGETAVPELTPGKRWDGTVRLNPGLYRLWCSLPEHARLGMHATLRVIR